ncbi:hypothetical protein A6U87_14885 [Rhizobium sp. AC44/96]|uniref:DUF3800 domain-containing protein n=1 Tax=Rhizobium sp. AC44/96 TaxID=1841654 RepID=UPI00080FDE19|nr:DUF3800 domain-containing protein [Rhizobium sp. AC44/96]OCJ05287.1 hypothetical protein A6U87_14885 [Rhizobium sp. AC44/96]
MNVPDFEFIAYIDEAGDPSLKRVRPIDDKGGTEWMVVSAILVSRDVDPKLKGWVAEICQAIGSQHNQVIHFKDLTVEQKLAACNYVGGLPIRIFTVASNKKNMRRYRNERAERVHSRQWFYNWLVRILIERMTDWCWRRVQKFELQRRHVKFVFSQSGGHLYSQTAAYHELLRYQSQGNIHLRKWIPRREVMNMNLVEAYPHWKFAGLQLADIAASSFYQAVDNLDTGPCDVQFAKALAPRLALNTSGEHRDYSLVLQPTPPWEADISADQKEVFEYFGYDFTRPIWAK